MITGEKREDLNNMLTFEHPAHPLKTTAIDLLHPTDLKTMRPEALPAFLDTARRKSTRAVKFLADKGGEDAIAKSIVVIRDKKPADGQALVNVSRRRPAWTWRRTLVRGS